MPVRNIRMIVCDACGKLIKVEKFGDAMTPLEWERFNKTKQKRLCIKCKLLRKK